MGHIPAQHSIIRSSPLHWLLYTGIRSTYWLINQLYLCISIWESIKCRGIPSQFSNIDMNCTDSIAMEDNDLLCGAGPLAFPYYSLVYPHQSKSASQLHIAICVNVFPLCCYSCPRILWNDVIGSA